MLAAAGIAFSVRVAEIDETPLPGELPRDYVMRLAAEKAAAVPTDASEIVLAADTTVVVDGLIFGKPEDAQDARRMLRALSGKRHDVMTGICLKQGSRLISDCETTGVWFEPMSPQEIDAYVETNEPLDKAGAYACQGIAGRFISRIDGSYSNVVGLPIALVYRQLKEIFTTGAPQ